ncbi:MAG: hypothetical protein ACLPV2_06255 [Steroidobacteraceae bacterium]
MYSYSNTDGVKTPDWTLVDPTLKLGLTNTIDAELQVTPYGTPDKNSGEHHERFRIWRHLRAPEDQRARR